MLSPPLFISNMNEPSWGILANRSICSFSVGRAPSLRSHASILSISSLCFRFRRCFFMRVASGSASSCPRLNGLISGSSSVRSRNGYNSVASWGCCVTITPVASGEIVLTESRALSFVSASTMLAGNTCTPSKYRPHSPLAITSSSCDPSVHLSNPSN